MPLQDKKNHITIAKAIGIILMVTCHAGIPCSYVKVFIYIFHMPLFFFISGFVLYKRDIQWNFVYSWKFLKKKFPVQIISTAVFFLASTYINNSEV